jgi:uncharacterized membrane protein
MTMRVAAGWLGWCFTFAIGALGCDRAPEGDGLGSIDAGAGASGALVGAGGTGGAFGSAGSGGAHGGQSGSGGGQGDGRDAGSFEPLPPCPTQPEAAGAALLRVPSVLPDGFTSSSVGGISADGRTVVGALRESFLPGGNAPRAFRWTMDEGAVLLDVPPDAEESTAIAASADGSVIVGTIFRPSDSGERAVVWRSGVPQVLETLDSVSLSVAYSVNDDGTVIVGTVSTYDGVQSRSIPVRWTAAGVEALEYPGDATAIDVSGDGATVAGLSL